MEATVAQVSAPDKNIHEVNYEIQEQKDEPAEDNIDPVMLKYMAMIQEQKSQVSQYIWGDQFSKQNFFQPEQPKTPERTVC